MRLEATTGKRTKLSTVSYLTALTLALAILLAPFCVHAAAKNGAVLMDADSYRILYSENPDEQLEMASTTKVMTAILAIEHGDLSKIVTVSANASGIEGSSIWLSVGEHITLEDLLYGLMLSSGNDAAVAIAEEIGGSVQGFVEMMNEKAAEIGAAHTLFANPNGLPIAGHYTTAADLAKICSYAMRNETFRTIVGTQYREISWEGHEYKRVLKNKNKLLWNYSGANGIKTGYTKAAGRCLASAAVRDDMQLVAVVLNDGDMWESCKKLLDYGFENFAKYSIIGEGDYLKTVEVKNGTVQWMEVYASDGFTYPLTAQEYLTLKKTVRINDVLYAPIKKGDRIGEIEISLNNEVLATIPVAAGLDIQKNTFGFNLIRIIHQWLFGEVRMRICG